MAVHKIFFGNRDVMLTS